MEWEQISETGPPHNKTFTWSLKMGDMMTTGAANSKKGAKNKAAENMARKLDKLPKPKDRFAATTTTGLGKSSSCLTLTGSGFTTTGGGCAL